MKPINKIILKLLFMPLFVTCTFISVYVAGLALHQWGEAVTLAALIASAVYFIGMFVVTAIINVHLNNKLEKQTPGTETANTERPIQNGRII